VGIGGGRTAGSENGRRGKWTTGGGHRDRSVPQGEPAGHPYRHYGRAGDRLEEQSITNVQELGRLIPNANFVQPGAGNGPNATIGMRGVNTTDFIYTTDPGVGVYVDDVYHGTLTGSDMDLLDLDRVEVLRGPQGTLFGKNSLGGAIRLFSKQPQGNDTGSIDVTNGTSHRLDLKAFYDTKIADNLFMRIAGRASRSTATRPLSTSPAR
jgi:iron complex outermembrane recepter protein